MEITMKQDVNVKAFYAKSSMERKQKREDLKWLCSMIQKDGRFDNTRIKEALDLPEESYAEVLKGNLKDFGLIKGNSITEEGESCSKNGYVFMKEEGAYIIWGLEGHFLLRDGDFFRILNWVEHEKIPKISSSKVKKEATSQIVNTNGEESRKWVIQAYEEVQKYRSKLSLEWKIETGNGSAGLVERLHISGKFKMPDSRKSEMALIIEPEHIFEFRDLENLIKTHMIENLPAYKHRKWNSKIKAIEMDFASISSEERQSFRTHLELDSIEIEGQEFKASFEDIPICPYDSQAAKKWLWWLATQKINKHISSSELDTMLTDIRSETPILQEFDTDEIDLQRERKELWDSGNRKLFWYISASGDLKREEEDTEVIISGSDLSYPEAFRKLFYGVRLETIEKMIYVDKHMFLEHNAENAKKMVEAIRDEGFGGALTLVTDLKRAKHIPKLKGNTHIKDYGEIYGKTSVHGRYVVMNRRNNVWLFELTHNLVHPKNKNGKLLWSDISSKKLMAEEVSDDPVRSALVEYIKKDWEGQQ